MTPEDLRKSGWTERDDRWFPPPGACIHIRKVKGAPDGLNLRDALMIEDMRVTLAKRAEAHRSNG